MGIEIEEQEILSSLGAAVQHLRKHGSPRCHLLVREELKPESAEFPQSHTSPDFFVVGDIGDRWNYAIMNHVFRMLMYGAKLPARGRGPRGRPA